MRWLKQLILIIVSIPGIAGCNDDIIHNRITKADELLDDYPDSAIICLKELHRYDIKTRQDRALYSIVSTIANLKLGNDTIEDVLLADAWEYYFYNDEPSREKMLTHFAKAALLSKAGNNIEALTEYEKTIRYASGKNADRYKALSYFNMSSIYNEAYSYLDAKECIEEGKRYMLAANDTSIMTHGYLVSGMSYNIEGEHARALEELGNGLDLAIKSRDNEMADCQRLQIAYTQGLLNNHKVAAEMFDSLLQYSNCQLSDAELYIYVNSLACSGEAEKAERILNSLDSSLIASTKPYWIFTRSVTYSKKGNYKEAYELLSSTLDYQNSYVNDKLNASLVREQKQLAIANENIQRQLAENREKLLFLVSSLAVLAAAGGVTLIAFIIKRNKLKYVQAQYRHERQLSKMKSRIAELTLKSKETEHVNAAIALNLTEVKKMLAINEKENMSLKNERKALEKIIGKHLQTVTSLKQQLISNFKHLHYDTAHFCNHMPDGVSTPSAIKMYEIQRREMITKYRNEDILVLLEEQINELMSQILSHLKATNILNEEEMKILIYDFCGFSYKSMADILSINYNNMAVKRNRLKKKINQNIVNENDLDILKKNTSLWKN